MKKLLFVCTGNTCRSPMAEGIFNNIVKNNLKFNFISHSAGIYGVNGVLASKNAILTLLKYDIDIKSHVSRIINKKIFLDSFIVLTMTFWQKDYLLNIFKCKNKIFTIKEYSGLNGEINDPYGGDLEAYIAVYEEIKECILRIINKISVID